MKLRFSFHYSRYDCLSSYAATGGSPFSTSDGFSSLSSALASAGTAGPGSKYGSHSATPSSYFPVSGVSSAMAQAKFGPCGQRQNKEGKELIQVCSLQVFVPPTTQM